MKRMDYLMVGALALFASAATLSATVKYVGEDDNTGSKWRTPSVAKPNDLDADNVYGTAGYYLPRGLSGGYNDPFMPAGETDIAGAWNTSDLNAMPSWFTGLVVTNDSQRLRSWGGDGGNFGNLDNVGSGHTGWTGAPLLLSGSAQSVLGLLLKRSASPAFRLTLIVGNSTEAEAWQFAQTTTVDDGSGAVTQPMITPTFTATGKTTYQSWDISAGSSDVFIALDPAGVATLVRLAGLAVDTLEVIPPSVSSEPVGGTFLVGAEVSISGSVAGTAPDYQWFKVGGPSLPNATNQVLHFPSIAVADAGSYYFTAANAAGAVTSAVAVVAVETTLPPGLIAYQAAIKTQPSLVSYYAFDAQNARDSQGPNHGTLLAGFAFTPSYFGGATKTLTLTGGQVDLGTVPAFQFDDGTGTIEMWLRAGWTGPTPGGADAYIFACQDTANGLNYSVSVNSGRSQIILRNGFGNTIFNVSVGNDWHHLAVIFNAGEATLVWDDQVLTQPFGVGGVPASNQIGSSIPVDGGNTQWNGDLDEIAIYSEALPTNTILAHNSLSPIPPAITAQPVSKGAFVGEPLSLTVGASGPALKYQWYRNGTLLPAATEPTLAISSATLADAGSYYAVVTNQNLAVTSSVATISVWTPHLAAYETSVRAETSLISLYTFDTDEEGTAIVKDGKGPNVGNVIGSPIYETGLGAGTNRAFIFDGATLVSFGAVADFAFTNRVGTVECLFRNDRPVNSGINACLLSYRQDPDARYSFFAMSPLDSFADWNGAALFQVGTGRVTPSSWHHIVWVFDTNAPTAQAFFDGVLVGASESYTLGAGDPALATAQLGAANGSGGEFWVGALDNVAFYRAALSPNAVAQHFADLTGTVLSPPALAAVRSGSDIIISWDTAAAPGWVLEKSEALTGTAWTTVGTASPATIPITGEQGFMRLRKP